MGELDQATLNAFVSNIEKAMTAPYGQCWVAIQVTNTSGSNIYGAIPLAFTWSNSKPLTAPNGFPPASGYALAGFGQIFQPLQVKDVVQVVVYFQATGASPYFYVGAASGPTPVPPAPANVSNCPTLSIMKISD
jgi:hypothetical protein